MPLNASYLGNQVATIHGFGVVYPNYPLNQTEWTKVQTNIKDYLAANPTLGLLAITADHWQSHAHDFLISLGMRKVFVCKSSHNHDNENLTFWTRATVPGSALDLPVNPGPGNCSVAFNYPTSNARVVIVTTKPTVDGFKKIKGAAIWYKVDPQYVVKT